MFVGDLWSDQKPFSFAPQPTDVAEPFYLLLIKKFLFQTKI